MNSFWDTCKKRINKYSGIMSFKNLERKCKHRNSLTLSLLLTFWEIKLTACSLLKQNHKLINGLSFNTQATFTVLWHHKALLVLIFVPLPWFVSPPPPSLPSLSFFLIREKNLLLHIFNIVCGFWRFLFHFVTEESVIFFICFDG